MCCFLILEHFTGWTCYRLTGAKRCLGDRHTAVRDTINSTAKLLKL
jgi:hypothetical protein